MFYIRTATAIFLTFLLAACQPQSGDESAGVNWLHHGSDHASTKYIPLDQINRDNFSELEVAWTWGSADYLIDEDLRYFTGDYRATPIFVNGVVYMTTNQGQVAALDAASGEQLWLYDPESYQYGPPQVPTVQTRGIEYWTDGDIERIFLATLGKQLVSIIPATGEPDPNFGDNGIVDLRRDLGPREFDLNSLTQGPPPIVVGSNVIVGSKVDDYIMYNRAAPGHVRAYDAYTGQFKWRFNTIPQPGEPYIETWEDGSWETAGSANIWVSMTADDELGIVYLPVSAPTPNYWGGMRLGDNVYGDSLVALNAETGERLWHFQTVHHNLWDYDPAAAPNLVDVTVDGREIKAVAQVSKTGYTYVFDRVTGEPLWPIEERPVPQSTATGERSSPTQPHPTWPLPYDRIGITEDDLIDFTPELRAEAEQILSEFVLGPLFNPPIVAGQDGKRASALLPGGTGGANFPGASVDPETGFFYVQSQTRPSFVSLAEPEPGDSDWGLVNVHERVTGPQGLPLIKPPYRRITAIDLNTGEHAWQIPFGKGPTDHPAIAHLELGPLGSWFDDTYAEGGIIVTKTLLISYLAQKDEVAADATGSVLVALDKATGEIVGEVLVDQRLHGALMSYQHNGKQYVAAAAGGRGEDVGELVVLTLP